MNYLKLSSIANLQIGKRDCQKRFVQNQSAANKIINDNHKTNYNYNEAQEVMGISMMMNSDARKVKFNQTSEGSKIQGKILEQQLKLRSLQSTYDLEKSRIQDEQNAKTFRIRYPYGKENVRITGDVLQKYRGNNMDQANVLKKFQQQAKQLRQLKNTQKRLYLQTSRQTCHPQDIQYQRNQRNMSRQNRRKVTSILQRQKNKLYKAKEEYLKEMEKTRELQRKENKRIQNIQNMLKDVKEKLNENFSMIVESQSQNDRERRFVRRVDVARARLQNLRAVDMSQEIARCKVPVVVYNNVKGEQSNFVNRSLCLQMIDYEKPQKLDKPEDFQKVLKIYNMNKLRLDRLCQKITVGNNHSSIIY